MKSTKQSSSKEVNTDDLISKLISLESKGLSKKKKSKRPGLITDPISSKRAKLDVEHNDTPSVPSPIKVKSEKWNLEPEQKLRSPTQIKVEKEISKIILPGTDKEKNIDNEVLLSKKDLKAGSSSENEELAPPSPVLELPRPIAIKSKKEKTETEIQSKRLDNRIKKRINTEETLYSRDGLNASNNEEVDPKSKLLKSKIGRTSRKKELLPLPIKIKQEKDSNNSSEDEHLSSRRSTDRRRSSSHSESTDTEDDKGTDKTLLKVTRTPLDNQCHTEGNFENSSVHSEKTDDSLSSQEPKWIQKLQSKNPGLKKVIINTSLPRGHVKYCLIRVPKTINLNTLLGLKFSFDEQVYVTLNNKQYLFNPLEKKPQPICVNFNVPQLVNLESVIMLQKAIPPLSLNNPTIQDRQNIPLPEVKTRHPLFGGDYKKRISIEKNINKKIVEAIETKAKMEKKEKKKKHKAKQKNNLVNNEEIIMDLLHLNTLPKYGRHVAEEHHAESTSKRKREFRM